DARLRGEIGPIRENDHEALAALSCPASGRRLHDDRRDFLRGPSLVRDGPLVSVSRRLGAVGPPPPARAPPPAARSRLPPHGRRGASTAATIAATRAADARARFAALIQRA